ncbi:MAG: hypothetical protein LBC71_03840 [Oscillospiraceae bacterium]|jgi:hypothetical protein|nr:hypothetical protein [Oscillospiraceae bacterium]
MLLKNKSGLSLIFVTGIMFLLLGIGTSVMAAASATVGAGMRQNEYNRAMALSNSIHRSIEYSLNNMAEYEEASLGYNLAHLLEEQGSEIANIEIEEMTLAGDNPPDIDFESVTIAFLAVQVIEGGPSGYIPAVLDAVTGAIITPPQSRIPYTVEFNVQIVVTVQINTGGRLFRAPERLITTQAFYNYTGGFLSDEFIANEVAEQFIFDYPDVPVTVGTFNPGSSPRTEFDPGDTYELRFSEYGAWTLVDFIVGEVHDD